MSSDTIGENKKVKKFKSRSQYDATYDPNKPEASESQYVTSEVKERLCAICPAPRRCMVTLESAEYNPIEICHILAHQMKPGFIRILQQHWAMKNPLDVNIPENLTFLRVDMHRLFDRGDWALFPDITLVKEIKRAYEDNEGPMPEGKSATDLFQRFKMKNGKPFRYWLVWLKDSDASTNPPILRRRLLPASNSGVMLANDIKDPTATKAQKPKKRNNAALEAEIAALQLEIVALRERLQGNRDTKQGTTVRKSARIAQEYIDSILPNHQLFQPPYTDFPAMESHIHPLFVIFNSGEKLRGREDLINLDRGIPELKLVAPTIFYLYQLWSTHLQRDGTSPGDGHEDDDDNDEDNGEEGGDDDDEEDDKENGDDNGEDDVNGGEDEVREDDHDVNASDENNDDRDEDSHHEHGEGGHDGSLPKSRPYIDKLDKPQGIQDGDDLPRDQSTHFDTSTDTPELVDDSRQGSVKPTDTEGSNARHDSDTSDYGDFDRWIAEWAASAEPESNIKLLTNDHQLRRYKKEPARKPPFEQWQHWAHSPPDLPMTIRDTDDTSHYTSYLWALYCEDSNLLAPDGSPYRVPKPWNQYRS